MTNNVLESLLFQIAVLLGAGLAGGAVARKFRQPAVLGELLGGIVLGKSIFGSLMPHASADLLPADPAVAGARDMVTNLGLLFFCLSPALKYV